MQQGEYVLCKLFHKNDIGPPSGNRYAAFLEEEWEDWDEKALIHGENVKVMEDHVPIDVDNNGNNQIQQVFDSYVLGFLPFLCSKPDIWNGYRDFNGYLLVVLSFIEFSCKLLCVGKKPVAPH